MDNLSLKGNLPQVIGKSSWKKKFYAGNHYQHKISKQKG